MLSLLQKPFKPQFIKSLTTTTTKNKTNQNEFETVYVFPYIRGLSLINRMKLYHTILTATTIPGTTISNLLGHISDDYVILVLALGVAGVVPLYGFGYFVNKLVGRIYLHKQEELVRLSYLNFWGSRKDIVVPTNDIVPFSEMPASFIDSLYMKVKLHSSRDVLKVCTQYGVVNSKGFNKIFLPLLFHIITALNSIDSGHKLC